MSSDKKRCTGCERELPKDEDHFPTRKGWKGKRYLRARCINCHGLESHAHYQVNRKRYKVERAEYAQHYRAEHRDAINLKKKRSRLKCNGNMTHC